MSWTHSSESAFCLPVCHFLALLGFSLGLFVNRFGAPPKIHIFKLISFNYYANVITFCAFLLPRGDSLVLSEMSECDSGWDSVLLCLCCQSLKQYSLSITESQWSLVKPDENWRQFYLICKTQNNYFGFFLIPQFYFINKTTKTLFFPHRLWKKSCCFF